ncbi:MAG: permease [Bdellovibrio sp. CG12_big_fil_rev_8_21_14_0_65_39_13]|nr:MAG: permease [Bdellovibrio sp. CG22_combo_CG10-13_8_21_14_all_39_27]PIQ58538.1 MAG: permease [Bdellovibrio sp. CG12_big_fil_rev_8_21_14_0_65_39_13]PIR34153.1 MAG: permease [Bdellovibrio sp. CG11_big_fil_rev_8_21_14_0_20_39_38]
MILFIWGVAFTLTGLSFLKDKQKTYEVLIFSIKSLKKLLPTLFGMVFFVGFILTIFPEEKIMMIFNHKGYLGFFLVSLVGAIVTIPGPIAFPLAGALLKMGAPQELLASFISTLTMVGLSSSLLEISYFGKRFTFLRQGSSFISAMLIGLIMGSLL